MKKIIFSGIQPSGNLHIGNYIGAISQWEKMQDNYENIFCIVDLHAITVPQDPKILREKILEFAALYLACGIDPEKSHIFIQSENPDHAYMTWIFNCITPFGILLRMTQFKDKSQDQKEKTTAGLFDYPVLMASDILLYLTDEVPVGEDQKQHIELACDLAEKFNNKFGEVFKLPKPVIQKETGRIMSLQDPENKMSKSDNDSLGAIHLLDSEDEIRNKIKKAVTDSESSISKEKHNEKGAIHNLLVIFAAFSNSSFEEALDKLDGMSYSEFKSKLADLLVEKLGEIQIKYNKIRNDKGYLRKVLDEGRDFAKDKSSVVIKEVKQRVGFS
ncbi:MAG: tryptophan--tRNA ligase [Candidatus Levyibacteriota bacterium]